MLDGLAIGTLLSHLACADEPGHALNPRQLRDFRAVVAAVPAKRASLANSAGILLGSPYAFDLTRPGLALYGGQPVPEAAILPVVSPAAQVLQVREVSVGATVGYGATWTPARASRVAILNLGYADGLFRKLGPHLATVDGIPVVGRISMDLVAIDVTDSGAREGDWIAFRYDLLRLAAATGLSQYELLTGLGSRFERVWR